MSEIKTTPLVSVCIPTYNSADFIAEMLTSITNQSYKNIEIIVGDNASTDNTEKIVNAAKLSDARIKYYKNTDNLGYSGNCNKLIELAQGEFVAIYHSDDIYSEFIVQEQVELLMSDKNIAGCFTSFSNIDMNGITINKISNLLFASEESKLVNVYDYERYINLLTDYGRNIFFCPSSMVRKKEYVSVGGYSEKVKFTEDQDMWIKLLELNKLAVIEKKLVKYRQHSQQVSTIYTDTTREIASPMISHLSEHLFLKHGASNYLNKYKVKIDRLLAIDDIRLAFNSTKQKAWIATYKIYREFIINSRGSYLLKINDVNFMIFIVIQRLPMWFTFLLLKTMHKIRHILSI